MPVLACGMIGAKQGWIDAGYRPVPCGPSGGTPIKAPTKDSRLAAWIIGGLSQADPHDVMRGEETQIAGLISNHPDFDGVVCLPGTHTKWTRVSGGIVHTFTTVMTGELFALLSTHSVLCHSMADGWDETAFLEALHRSLHEPGALAAHLFTVRAIGLLIDTNGAAARARLSGLLIGHELAATQHLWSQSPVAIIGTGALTSLYARALARTSAGPIIIPDGDMTLIGLRAAYRNLKDIQCPAP
jgi:2-dehydro-3-deoxygalactonokinase